MGALAHPKVNGAQRSWFGAGAVFTASLESLPYKVRELLADRDARERLERMDPGAAFVELRTVLTQMEHLAKEVMFETERARELFDSIDALATLPGPGAGVELEATDAAAPCPAGFLAAFLEIELMALAFERRHHREEVARFRAELHAGPPVPSAAESAPPRTVARPRERRDASRRSSARAGPPGDDDPGPPHRITLYLVHPRYGRLNLALARFLRRIGK